MIRDLTIALRVSPTLSWKHLFFTSKYDLVETCFDSLVESLEGLSYELVVILECPQFEKIFRQRINDKCLRILHTPGIRSLGTMDRNFAAFARAREVLNQAKTEYVYLAEDDYYYIGKMSEILRFINAENRVVDFVTPYDHPDYYWNMHGYKKNAMMCEGRKWKQVAATTMTFLTSKKNLQETEGIFRLFPILWDNLMWRMLTRKTVPWIMHPTLLRNSGYRNYRLPHFALYAIRNYPRYRRYSLWAPEPTIATHLDVYGLSPNICWRSEIDGRVETRRQARAR